MGLTASPFSSALYRVRVMHSRLAPRKHRFNYGLFMFALDLDELDELSRRSWLFKRNRFALYSFRDRDHYDFSGRDPQACIAEFLLQNGVRPPGGRTLLVTHLRTLGYIFNPVSFYYCLDAAGIARAVVAEVGNTFGEMKLFLIAEREGDLFRKRVTKHYYVSPFIALDAEFDFRLAVPGENLDIRIDDYENAEKVLVTTLRGNRLAWNDLNILRLTLRYPMVTLGVIALIHWNALMIYLKKIRHISKSARPEMQRDVLRSPRRRGHL